MNEPPAQIDKQNFSIQNYGECSKIMEEPKRKLNQFRSMYDVNV